jgi:hypothetical protein
MGKRNPLLRCDLTALAARFVFQSILPNGGRPGEALRL